VAIRSLTAGAISQKPYYYEMPFTVQADGPYFSVLDCFARLGRLSRIINIGDLKLQALNTGSTKFHLTAGSSVSGTFTITTFFTNSAQQGTASAGAPAKH
jgi:Tfp pilus assembly protein PilO